MRSKDAILAEKPFDQFELGLWLWWNGIGDVWLRYYTNTTLETETSRNIHNWGRLHVPYNLAESRDISITRNASYWMWKCHLFSFFPTLCFLWHRIFNVGVVNKLYWHMKYTCRRLILHSLLEETELKISSSRESSLTYIYLWRLKSFCALDERWTFCFENTLLKAKIREVPLFAVIFFNCILHEAAYRQQSLTSKDILMRWRKSRGSPADRDSIIDFRKKMCQQSKKRKKEFEWSFWPIIKNGLNIHGTSKKSMNPYNLRKKKDNQSFSFFH